MSKTQYYCEFFTSIKDDNEKLWKVNRHIINVKGKNSFSPTKLTVNDKEVTDPSIAFFANIGSSLANSIPSVDNASFDYLKPRLPDSFYLTPAVTSSEIEQVITNLNANKSSGPYSICTEILKLLKKLHQNHLRPCLIAYSHLELFQKNF